MAIYQITHYLTADQKAPYAEWFRQLRDSRAKVAIIRRIERMELGNFGDHKYCRDEIWELRVDSGPGYRVYYTLPDIYQILLLQGGTKRSQRRDIERAIDCWQDWRQRET
jgi:putative addiction module killer protein